MLLQDALLIERLSRAASIDPALDHRPLLSARQCLRVCLKTLHGKASAEARSALKLPQDVTPPQRVKTLLRICSDTAREVLFQSTFYANYAGVSTNFRKYLPERPRPHPAHEPNHPNPHQHNPCRLRHGHSDTFKIYGAGYREAAQRLAGGGVFVNAGRSFVADVNRRLVRAQGKWRAVNERCVNRSNLLPGRRAMIEVRVK